MSVYMISKGPLTQSLNFGHTFKRRIKNKIKKSNITFQNLYNINVFLYQLTLKQSAAKLRIKT